MNKVTYLNKIAQANLALTAYNQDDLIMTDQEYDLLIKDIKSFESKNPQMISDLSPTQRVGDLTVSNRNKNKHIDKMYSLEDAFDEQDVREWLKRLSKNDILLKAEPKFDGASGNILYESGNFVSLTTRGDGVIGEDVSENAKYIDGIPMTIPYKGRVEIRGEITIFLDSFDYVNQTRVLKGKEEYSNPRNAASGAMRNLESEFVIDAKLKFSPYSLGYNELDFDTQNEESKFFYEQGFSDWGMPLKENYVTGIKEIMDMYNQFIAIRDKFPMMLDGMVLKVDDKHLQEELGFRTKDPYWALAFKFPPEEKVTILRNVIIQVGKSGAQAPVGEIDETEIGGVKVRRVTLHNFDEIKRKDLKIGDSVILIRSGDVIPKITKVLKDRRDGSEIEITAPTECQTCGDKNLNHDGAVLKCTNPECQSMLTGSIIYAAGRKALDIQALGKSTITDLVELKLIKNLVDLFNLKVEDFLKLPSFKIKKATKVFNEIQSKKGEIPAERLLNAVDIPLIGQTSSKKLVIAFGERCFKRNGLTFDDLMKVDDIGNESAEAYIQYMENHGEYIENIFKLVDPVFEEVLDTSGKCFDGLKIVITGTLSQSRDVFKKLAEDNGAKVSGSVSKNTAYLLAGDKAGSKKDKAEALGVTVLNENEFMKLIS